MRKRYFFFLCLLFFVQIGYCQQLIQINNNSVIRDIGKDVWVLEDKTNAWSIHDILQASQQAQFRQSHLQVPNWSATTSSVWVKIYINIPQNERYFLEVSYPILSQLDFYAFKDNGQYEIFRSGNSLPFEQRILKNNHFYFELSPNCHTYYLRATSYEILQIPIKVGKIESFFEQNQVNSILNGIYLGFVILIVFYNFFLYISTKERIYLSYILYVFAVGLVTANLLGYNFQFLYPNFPQLNFYASILYPLNFFVLIFSMDFLNIKEKAPQYRKGFQILIYICVAEIGLNLLGFPHLMFQISQVVGLLVVGYILFVTTKLYGRGYRPAKFFLIAFTTFLSGIIITILLSVGVIPYSLWAYHSIQIGSAVEIVLLSFAVADKINIYKRETAEAQLMALQKAEENQRIISAQKEELENKVKERTLQIEKQKEEILTQNENLLKNQEEIQAQSSALEEQNIKLSAYQKLINEINYDLQMTNAQLEVQVEERTLALTQANEELIKQNHQLEEYAFVTAHQLRAPVARLLGLASIFDFVEMGKNSYNADIVRKMQAETTYLDEIIKDLSSVLAFQKGESVNHEIVNLGEQIHIVLKKLEIEIQDSQAFIDIDLREEIFIKTIPSYIQNIFYHLLSNAIKFRHESRKLIIEVKISASTDHELLITVKDNGLGIDMKYAREKIFGLYQRFHPTINGKGIGLYLVKNQVAYLNGRIEVKSEENIGTTFLIYLQKMS